MLYKNLVKKVSISPEKKTKQKDYLPKGQLPIIDQGQQLIGGYSDNLDMQLSCKLPVIVFGDHTRSVKYVDFPFGAGADGIKVLEPTQGVHPKYLYYATQYLVLQLEDRGYARHYQYIEKKELNIPSIPEQNRIVSRIEELFSELDNGVETLKKTKQQLAVYRQAVYHDNVPLLIRATDSLGNVFLPEKEGFPLKRYVDLSTEVLAKDYGIKLRAGEIYGLSVVVDPAFDPSSYSLEWSVMSGLAGDNYRKTWENVTQIEFPVVNKTVGSSFEITCRLKTHKDWHKHNWYDDCFEVRIYTVLPPVEDSY